MKPTLEKYNIYPTTYYYWKRKYIISGDSGLYDGNYKQVSDRVKELERELRLYKEMVAEKDLLLRLKDELLKRNAARK